MSAQLILAIRVISQSHAFVLLASLLWSFALVGIGSYEALVSAIAAIVLSIATYGRLSTSVAEQAQPSVVEHIKSNGVNYIVVAALLLLPGFLFKYFLMVSGFNPLSSFVAHGIFAGAFSMLTLYAVPIVFVKRLGLVSIVAGMSFLFSHLRASVLPLVVLSLLTASKVAISYWALLETVAAVPGEDETGFFRGGAFAYNFVSVFMEFLVFTIAVATLRGKQYQLSSS